MKGYLTIAAAVLAGATLAADGIQINGAGATFPNPIYQKWFSEYNKLHPDVRINYQSVGSGAGIRQITNRTVFFGATDSWGEYLSKVSPEFRKRVGVATSVQWPVGVGGQRNEGVAGLVSQTPGSLGYVELIYALQNKISYGQVQNMNGKFVRASAESVTAAADAAAAKMPADFRVSITNAPG